MSKINCLPEFDVGSVKSAITTASAVKIVLLLRKAYGSYSYIHVVTSDVDCVMPNSKRHNVTRSENYSCFVEYTKPITFVAAYKKQQNLWKENSY